MRFVRLTEMKGIYFIGKVIGNETLGVVPTGFEEFPRRNPSNDSP